MTSVLLQVILLILTLRSVTNDSESFADMNMEPIYSFRKTITKWAMWYLGILTMLFGFSLPLVMKVFYVNYSGFAILTESRWFLLGSMSAVIIGCIYSVVCYFLHGTLVKKGFLSFSEKEGSKYRYRYKLKRKMVLWFACTLLLSVILQNIFTAGGDTTLYAKGTTFHDYDSFIAYMEQDIPYDYTDTGNYTAGVFRAEEQAATMAPQNIFQISGEPEEEHRSELFKTQLTDHEGNVLCEYMDRNRSVCSVRFQEKDGSILPIKTVTYAERDLARAQIFVIQRVFLIVYIVEAILFVLLYFKKRNKMN